MLLRQKAFLMLVEIFTGMWLSLAPALARGDELRGKVIGVADGDTITIITASNSHVRVRISGIDAPEKGQAFSQVAKNNLSRMIFGRHVVAVTNKVDRYGRAIGVVVVDGYDVGLRQIEQGLAWHYKAYQREQSPDDRDRYSTAEHRARAARLGLWQETNPTPPWDWRKSKRVPRRSSDFPDEHSMVLVTANGVSN